MHYTMFVPHVMKPVSNSILHLIRCIFMGWRIETYFKFMLLAALRLEICKGGRTYLAYFLMIKDFAISSLPCVLNLKLTPEIYALTVDGE
jgi:hypothetical protein